MSLSARTALCAFVVMVAFCGCTYQRKVVLKRTELPEFIYRTPMENDYMASAVAVFNLRAPAYAAGMGQVAAELLYEELLTARVFASLVHEADVSDIRMATLMQIARSKGYDLIITGELVYYFEGSDHHSARVDERIQVLDVKKNNMLWYAKAVEVGPHAPLVDYAVVQGLGSPAPTTRTLFKRNSEKFVRMLLSQPSQRLWTVQATEDETDQALHLENEEGAAGDRQFLGIPFEDQGDAVSHGEEAPAADGDGPTEAVPAFRGAIEEIPMNEDRHGGQSGSSVQGVERELFGAEPVYFELDQARLLPAAQEILSRKARWLMAHPTVLVEIQGHCDERGTDPYNLALGAERARNAKGYLVSFGVPPDRLLTVSYGTKRPVDPHHHEGAWFRNRRAEFVIVRE
jgi:peptidoglycan-associated lipoprotein